MQAIFSCDSKEDANNRYLTKSHAKIAEATIIMPRIAGMDGNLIQFIVSLQMKRFEITVSIECQDQLINAEVRKVTKYQRSSLRLEFECSLNEASYKQQ